MSTITKEQAKDLRNAFQCWQQYYDPVEDKEQYGMFGLGVVAMDTLLALLEAEESGRNPVLAYADSYRDMAKQGVESIPVWSVITDLERNIAPLYAAPPAPVNAEPVAWLWSHRKHPSEVTLVRPEDDERAEGANWSGWSCQALYASPPAPVSVPDEYVAAVPTPTNLGYEAGWNACRAAMLQGADRPQSVQQNIPKNIPTLREAVDTIRNSGIELDAEKILAERDALNGPVLPDGWVMVPKEPTEHMIVEGFESEPDEFFSDEKEWEEYEAMSGCQQAAHRAKLCWAAMISAAPKI